MISHVVLLKPKAGLDSGQRRALADAFGRATREIPTVRGVRIGARVKVGSGYESAMPDAADFMAIIDFDDVEGLKAYLHHPVHQELGARFWESLASAFVYDFDVAGLEMLDRLVESP